MREHKYLPATFNDRISAFSFDYGLVALVLLIMIFMKIHPEYDPLIKIIVILVFWYIFNIVPAYFKPGITLGKRSTDIIILDENYKEVTILTIHLRQFFILLVSIFTIGLYLVVSFILLDRRIDKRSIHDLIFKTRVVRRTPFIGKGD